MVKVNSSASLTCGTATDWWRAVREDRRSFREMQAQACCTRALDHSGELRMPPAGRLPDEAVAAIGEWINAGAPFAGSSTVADLDWDKFEEADLWAFRPVSKIDAPGDVDSFLRIKLAEAGLTPAPRADRPTLIRRATIDLTGPAARSRAGRSVRQGSRWRQSCVRESRGSPLGFAALRRALGSPLLDVTRYADTAGFSNDYERPNAWRYRDYVIRSFNNDKPLRPLRARAGCWR